MRTIALIFGLLCAVGARGQIYLNSYAFGGGGVAGLFLDTYPGAAVAFSFRKLRTAYTGDCIEVRRSSTNTTQIIGFSGDYLDTVSLKTFCAGTDCFVRTWYDQSTNAYNATQTTAANQPRIVLNGIIEYEGAGVPAARFNGSSDFMRYDAASALFTTASQMDAYYVGRSVSTSYNTVFSFRVITGGNTFMRATFEPGGVVAMVKRNTDRVLVTAASAMSQNTNVRRLWTFVDTSTNATIYRNNTTIVNNAAYSIASSSYTSAGMGATINDVGAPSDYLNGTIQELIIYPTNQASPTTVGTAIMTYYGL